MTEHNEQHGWMKFSERWPTKDDCDIYGNIEIAYRSDRGFTSLSRAQDCRYNLTRAAWWRKPTPLPYIT